MLIASGTFLLWTGNFFYKPLRLIDALFTATSAVCVTGLIVVDTGSFLSPFSQWVVLLLIQMGGLGVMTAFTALPLLRGSKIGIRQRLLFTGGLGLDTPAGAVRLLAKILKMTFAIELFGALLLFGAFLEYFEPARAMYNAVFHSVSAFCNAGFSTFSGSLVAFSETGTIPGTVMALIVLGGLGFIPLSEVVSLPRGRRLSPYCRLVLSVTFTLIIVGSFLLLISEWNGLFRGIPFHLKIWNALFQSITARTAGFNTIPIPAMSTTGLFVLCLLMIIGASPGSTGGGMKTTTFGILALSSITDIRGRKEVVLSGHRLPPQTVRKALTLTFLYVGTILGSAFILSLTEPFDFRGVFFEVVSALGTVGLSTGITGELSDTGKLILILLMFWGRVGIVTFVYGMLETEDKTRISYADTNVPI
ncbi:MAG TPA: potassium transporter Trk [Synergistaceae bacterium]|nr:potassium transporter Trk [Synergistaceae bacterium]